jgi:predicted Zn finger-like uncharacterized protein
MILTCPACETRYNVADEAVSSAAGRQVRCATCGHIWHFAAALQETLPLGPRRVAGAAPGIVPPLAVARAALATAAAEVEDADSLLHLRTPAATPATGSQHIRRSLWGLASLLAVFTAALTLIFARDTMVREWPVTAVVYGAFGIKTAGSGEGLDLKVAPTWIAGDFVIDTEITNKADSLRAVPRLRLALLDSSLNYLEVRIIDPDIEPLAPGATARVRTIFEHPTSAAIDVEVTFATE